MTTAVIMSSMSNRKTNKMKQQQMQQENAGAQQPVQPLPPVQEESVKEEAQASTNPIRDIAVSVSIYRKKGLTFQQVYDRLEANTKGFISPLDLKNNYLKFVNEESISTPKWEQVLEFELEHPE